MVNWKWVTRDSLGGLGVVGTLRNRKFALLIKWRRFFDEENPLWRNIIESKYGVEDCIWFTKLETKGYGTWNKITRTKAHMEKGICFRLGKSPVASRNPPRLVIQELESQVKGSECSSLAARTTTRFLSIEILQNFCTTFV